MSTVQATPLEFDIAAFAASVRHHLDDLPADEVDELVDGLEADMGEQASESGEAFVLPDAAAYAAELRAAAGLPPRVESSAAEGWRTRARARFDALRTHPRTAAVAEFLAILRPAWWVMRALIVFGASALVIRGGWFDPLNVAVLLLCVIVSVQWGRRRWLPARSATVVTGVLNLISVLLLPMLVITTLVAVDRLRSSSMQTIDYVTQPGLTTDGERVRNIFAYDANGEPLTDVQLFDQDGRPLTTVGRDGVFGEWEADDYFLGGGGPVPIPRSGPGLQPIWNVYPLLELPPGSYPWVEESEDLATTPAFPFPQVLPSGLTDGLGGPIPDGFTASPPPSPSPTPTDSTTGPTP